MKSKPTPRAKQKAEPARKLLLVSNRLPYNLPRRNLPLSRNVGGLVNALEPVIVQRGGGWIGWDGIPLSSAKAVKSSMEGSRAYKTPTGIELHGVPLSDREISRYYRGFSNRSLWPLFHDFSDKAVYNPEDFNAYLNVNRRFAEIVSSWVTPDSRVWVQDFHLMLVPRYLRAMGFQGRIDFFLHIPFPAMDLYRKLPWRADLLRGVLASDAIGFHVESYRDHFVEAARVLCGAQKKGPDRHGVVRLEQESHESLAFAAPIGIDVDDFERLASDEETQARARRFKESGGAARILFGADRLDYTKGIKERMSAFEYFLKTHQDAMGKVTLIQVVVPGRSQVEEYRVMKREIDGEVGRINGELGRVGWTPIQYRYRALDRKELVAKYLAADVALITPLRDGMNLVAAEYAASRVDEDGALILSEFAGIAESAPGAILVNPYDRDGYSQAIGRALSMSEGERRERMRMLRRRIRANPATQWADRCLKVGMQVAAPAATAARARPVIPEPVAERQRMEQ